MKVKKINIIEQDIKKIVEYSDFVDDDNKDEKEEQLRNLIKEISISISLNKREVLAKECGISEMIGIHNVYNITIKRDDNEISFKYYDSDDNTRKKNKPDVYSLLCSCKNEYSCPNIFDDFCREYGYDSDSRKMEKLWKLCLAQSAKLKQIFNDEEIQLLPS